MTPNKGFSTVKITIEGRKYPVKCTLEEAKELKKVEKSLQQQLTQYRLKYAQLDKQDCLSMALIENQMEQLVSRSSAQMDECLAKLGQLESLLDKALA